MEETISLQDLYNELKKIESSMITKEELDRAIESVSVLSNEDTMNQIRESEEDIKKGEVMEVSSVEDLS